MNKPLSPLTHQPTPAQEFWAGVRAILPLVIGSIPFAIIFGAIAVTGALTPAAAAGMSAFVFAGSAQFLAAQLAGSGASIWVIIFTTLIVNLRHALYATTLAPHVKHLGQRWLLPMGFTLTDESFVVAIQRYNQPDQSPFKHYFYIGTAATLYLNWQVATWIGIGAGQLIANPRAWGLDLALPVTFIGMLIPMIVSRSLLACVIAAGISSILFRNLPHQLGLTIAALIGVAAGLMVERFVPQAHVPARSVADEPAPSPQPRP